MLRLEGIPISPGLAYGVAVIYDFEVGRRLEVPRRDLSHTDVESEWDRLDDALARSNDDLHLVKQNLNDEGSHVQTLTLLSAHLAMTSEITGQVKQHIRRDLVNVEQALFIGHKTSELEGARAVGMKTVAFNYDSDAPADYYVEKFADILQVPLLSREKESL